MADSAFEVDLDSDARSIDRSEDNIASNEQLLYRVQSLQQKNRVLKTEIETPKSKIKDLAEVTQQLRRNSVNIQAKAEQEEEYISNTLLKKITELKKEKESLTINYEQEEDCLINQSNRKFTQLRQEKVALERTLAREQEDQVSKLKLRIEKIGSRYEQQTKLSGSTAKGKNRIRKCFGTGTGSVGQQTVEKDGKAGIGETHTSGDVSFIIFKCL
ncbi:hypothetical protein AHF37_09294 [Paragonimus kellicotti]|nr:hypothetical protein AHF37_09294 [Paragonimus kellicotti]